MPSNNESSEYEAGLVSVIMPCFNAEQHLEEAVDSVFGQSYAQVELVVVDDGSSDRSPEILERLQHQHAPSMRVMQQQQRGPYPARNRALREARGELVAFLDADDYWDPEFLASMVDALADANADVAYCGWQNVGNPQRAGAPYIPPDYRQGDIVQSFLRSSPWPIHAAVVRRQVVDAIGGFSERFFSTMDYDLWLRLLPQTRNMVRVERVMAYYRWHDQGQISSKKWRQVLTQWSSQRAFIDAHPDLVAHLTPEQLREITDGVVLKRGFDALWRRDLDSAQPLFRHALRHGGWSAGQLKHLLPSLLPAPLYRRLVTLRDKPSDNGPDPAPPV